MDLTNCKQQEGESTRHWVPRVKEIIHSFDKMDAGSAVLMLEQNCRFLPLKMKLGRLKRDCNDMGTLMRLSSSTPILMVPRTPLQMMKGQGRERRTAMARVLSITRGTKEVASVKPTAA